MVVCNPLLQADCEGPYPHLLRRLLRHTYVRCPDRIRGIHLKVAIQMVRGNWMIMITVCRDLEPSAGLNAKFQTTHQAARLVTADAESLFSQTIGNPPRAVGLFGFPKQVFCRGFQRELFFGNFFRFSPHMLVETAPAYLHHLTEQGDGIGLPLPPDEVVSHFDSLAKKAAAFFNISRSKRRR